MCNCCDSFDCLLCIALSFEELDAEFPEKDRSISRKRHLNGLKAKERMKKTAAILEAKGHKLSLNATYEEEYRAVSRAIRAGKRVNRLLPKAERYKPKTETA